MSRSIAPVSTIGRWNAGGSATCDRGKGELRVRQEPAPAFHRRRDTVVDESPYRSDRIGDHRNAEVFFEDRDDGKAAPRATAEQERLRIGSAAHCLAAQLESELHTFFDAHRERPLPPLVRARD